MRYLKITIFLIFIINSNLFSQDDFSRYRKYGNIYISYLKNAAFPSTDRQSEVSKGGKTYTVAENYSDSSVIVFIPNNLSKLNATNIVFFFYGWMNSNYYTATTTDLIQQFIDSKKNAILVFPAMARFAPDSFEGNFKYQDRFKNYVWELLDSLYSNQLIYNNNLNKIILCGHSGGNRPIISILKNGGLIENISEVYLLDALYDEDNIFLRWMKNYNGRLINVFTDRGGTYINSLTMLENMERAEIGFTYAEENDYVFTKEPLFTNLFLHTKLDHGQVLEKNLFRYLSMSSLESIEN